MNDMSFPHTRASWRRLKDGVRFWWKVGGFSRVTELIFVVSAIGGAVKTSPDDGFSEEQAERHAQSEMWRNFKPAARAAITAFTSSRPRDEGLSEETKAKVNACYPDLPPDKVLEYVQTMAGIWFCPVSFAAHHIITDNALAKAADEISQLRSSQERMREIVQNLAYSIEFWHREAFTRMPDSRNWLADHVQCDNELVGKVTAALAEDK